MNNPTLAAFMSQPGGYWTQVQVPLGVGSCFGSRPHLSW